MNEDLRGRRPARRAMVIVGSVAVVALALSGAWILSGISKPTVTIVAIIPLSGAASYLAEIEDSMHLTVEKLNRWGGINGMSIRLVVEDCTSDPDIAMEKLIEAEEKYHPLAVITATREVALQMAEVAEERGIVLISVGASDEDLTDGKQWTFRYYIAPSDEADRAIETLKGLNVNSLGILYLDDAYGRTVMTRMTGAFEALNGTVETHALAKTTTEFSDAIAKVSDNEAVFMVGLRYQYPAMLAELNSSGYGGRVLCAIGASVPDMWSLPEAQGCYVNAPTMYMPGATVDDKYMMEFEERYGRALTHQGSVGSDAVRLIWGILSDKEVSRENLRDLLEDGFVYSGILGVMILDRGSHNVDIPVHRAVIEGGALQYL